MSKAACLILGIVALGYGLWWIYPPVCLVAVGLVLVLTAIGIHRSEESK